MAVLRELRRGRRVGVRGFGIPRGGRTEWRHGGRRGGAGHRGHGPFGGGDASPEDLDLGAERVAAARVEETLEAVSDDTSLAEVPGPARDFRQWLAVEATVVVGPERNALRGARRFEMGVDAGLGGPPQAQEEAPRVDRARLRRRETVRSERPVGDAEMHVDVVGGGRPAGVDGEVHAQAVRREGIADQLPADRGVASEREASGQAELYHVADASVAPHLGGFRRVPQALQRPREGRNAVRDDDLRPQYVVAPVEIEAPAGVFVAQRHAVAVSGGGHNAGAAASALPLHAEPRHHHNLFLRPR
jgi:hypothetical protein